MDCNTQNYVLFQNGAKDMLCESEQVMLLGTCRRFEWSQQFLILSF